MSLWDITIVLAVAVVWLAFRLASTKDALLKIAKRVDDLEAWVLPRKQKEEKERERERLRDDIEQGFRDGIMAPPEILREAYPETYPPETKKP
jgi:hypothetical protein